MENHLATPLDDHLGGVDAEAVADLDEGDAPAAQRLRAADVPPLQTILLPPDLSLGITPIGEGPNCGMSACIVNAVVDALWRMKDEGLKMKDVQVDIPILPERVLAKLTS